MNNQKQYTNQQLKYLILDLYKLYNIPLTEELNKQINKSSKTHYDKLFKIYTDIKHFIVNNISTSSNDNINDNIEINKKEIEIQTDDIIDDINIQNKNLMTDNFNLRQIVSNLKFKCSNYKKIIKDLNNKKYSKNTNSSNDNTDDENDNIIKEHRKVKYHQLPELSSYNIINELSKLSKHELKVLYNRYFSNKLSRLIT